MINLVKHFVLRIPLVFESQYIGLVVTVSFTTYSQ